MIRLLYNITFKRVAIADVVKIYIANENRKFVEILKYRISFFIILLLHFVEESLGLLDPS